jgi:hypothetical protein
METLAVRSTAQRRFAGCDEASGKVTPESHAVKGNDMTGLEALVLVVAVCVIAACTLIQTFHK